MAFFYRHREFSARILGRERVLSEAEYNSGDPKPRAKDGYPLSSALLSVLFLRVPRLSGDLFAISDAIAAG
jgi:hypothetical protein